MIQQVRHELDDKYSFAEFASLARENPVPDEIDVNDRRFLAPKSMIDEINGAVGRKLGVGETAYVISIISRGAIKAVSTRWKK